MIMNKAFNKAKRNDEEKVGLNIKISISMKNEFDELCKKNGVSMTAMMLSLIEVTLDEAKGIKDAYDIEVMKLVNSRISELEGSIISTISSNAIVYDEQGNPLEKDKLIEWSRNEINTLTNTFLKDNT